MVRNNTTPMNLCNFNDKREFKAYIEIKFTKRLW